MRRAGLGIRFFAGLIDLFIGAGGLVAFDLVAVPEGPRFLFHGMSFSVREVAGPTLAACALLAYASTDAFFAGTPGKKMLGLCVRSADGSPASASRRFRRALLKYLFLEAMLLLTIVQIPYDLEVVGPDPDLAMWINCLSWFPPLLTVVGFLSFLCCRTRLDAALYDRATGTSVYLGCTPHRPSGFAPIMEERRSESPSIPSHTEDSGH